jgi:hypothetical protein
MSAQKGFLLVAMEPPAELEEEFNDWYDMEHMPGPGGIPGFESTRRFVCLSGWPKYLALYDLAGIGVLDSPFYRRAAWADYSPWTVRMLGKVRGHYLARGDQVHPGDGLIGNPARLVLLRFRDVPDVEVEGLIKGLRSSYEGRAEVSQLRVLRSDNLDRIDYLAVVEARIPLLDPRPNADALEGAAARIDLVNEYVPYWHRGRLPGVTTS